MGLILYLEQKTTALEDCQFRFYLVNWKKEYCLPGQPDENLKSNTEAQPKVTWNCCWQLESIDSKDSMLLFSSFIAMIWSDLQYVTDTKARGTENWQVHKAEIPRFSDLTPYPGKEEKPSIYWAFQHSITQGAIQQYIVCDSKVQISVKALRIAVSQDATKTLYDAYHKSLQMSLFTSEDWKETYISRTPHFFSLAVIQHYSALRASLCFCVGILNSNSICNNPSIRRSVVSVSSLWTEFLLSRTS